MTVVAALLMPIVLLYQGWSFRVFRHRVSAPAPEPARAGEGSVDPAAG
jgi:cytochrome d ubiquinol oxidase subunit II